MRDVTFSLWYQFYCYPKRNYIQQLFAHIVKFELIGKQNISYKNTKSKYLSLLISPYPFYIIDMIRFLILTIHKIAIMHFETNKSTLNSIACHVFTSNMCYPLLLYISTPSHQISLLFVYISKCCPDYDTDSRNYRIYYSIKLQLLLLYWKY